MNDGCENWHFGPFLLAGLRLPRYRRAFEWTILHSSIRVKHKNEMSKNSVNNAALGPYEAACLLGVHWTRVAKMGATGILKIRTLKSSTGSSRIRVYSFLDVDENWTDYQYQLREGQLRRRERVNSDLRPGMLKEIAAIKNHIDFYDAISVYEAAEIMGVWHSFPPRMVASGVIVGRKLISHREGPSKSMIYSRKSCEENAEMARKMCDEPRIGRKRHAL